MPVHDWTRVDASIFHAFHHGWVADIARMLNRSVLPRSAYALPVQFGGPSEDVPGLQDFVPDIATQYATKANSVVVRDINGHQILAVVEVVSPGNKNSRHGLDAFVRKAVEFLQHGIHLLVVDLWPPGPRDPQGIHHALWERLMGEADYTQPADAPLTLAAYVGGDCPEAFVEPVAVGTTLPDMPVFLTPEVYIPVPLEATYCTTWEAQPAFWRQVLESTETA